MIHSRMFGEIRSKELFERAHQYALTYLEEVFDRPVFPTEKAIKNLAHFDEDLPDESTEAKLIIEQLHNYGAPATVGTLGGRYHGFVTGSVVPVGLAAKTMATYWDQVSAMYVISPIASKLESIVEQWLVQLFNLPKKTCAGFVSGTSSANVCGLAAARFRLLQRQDWDVNEKGLFGAPKIRIVTGGHAHSTVLKAVSILGLGKANIEFIDVDDQGRIIPEKIPTLDQHTLLILQAGNVNSGSFDDFKKIIPKAKRAGAWVHVDGAFGLWAAGVENLKYLTEGIGDADSWAADGHKTLNTPYDSGIIMCKDQAALISALHMSAGYIIESKERDGMFFTPEMSRRARIIELWAILKYLGRKGLDEMVQTLHKRAQQFAAEISGVDGFTIENEVVFNQVIFRCNTAETTDKVLTTVQSSGECWAGGSTWFGRRVIRLSVCAWTTTEQDITCTAASFTKALKEIS